MRQPMRLLLPLLLLLQSCAPDEYAAKLAGLLDSYSEQVSRRLAGEEKRYRREAKILQDAEDTAARRDAEEEIAAASLALAAEIKSGRSTGDTIVAASNRFGLAEFNRARELYTRNQESEMQRLRTLQSLRMERARVEGLRAALAVLAKKPDWQSVLAESGQFAKDTKGQLDMLSCQDLDGAVKTLTARVTALAAEIKAAASDAEKVKQLTAQQAGVQGALATATTNRAATKHFDTSATPPACVSKEQP